MTLKETIRNQILIATKSRNETVKNVLKVVLGEIDTQESRQGKPLDDDGIYKIVRKTIQGIEETLQYKPAGDEKLEQEKAFLNELIPKQLTAEDVKSVLSSGFGGFLETMKGAKSDGQATGLAMKFFKDHKMCVDGTTVATIVKEIRNGN